jgi:hypothetical protein
MKIWIYQADRSLNDEEKQNISKELEEFTGRWNAHGKKLNASFEIPYNHFIVLKVDEEKALASGCSIDDSVRFIKNIEAKYKLSFFDRQKVAYEKAGKIELANLNDLSYLYKTGEIGNETPVFNNLVEGEEYEKNWKLALKDTPFMRFVG